MLNLKLRKLSLAVSLATGVFPVSSYADEILFPQVISSNSVTTLLSVVNSGTSNTLHYRFYYKSTDNQSTCEETNFKQTSSPNDVVTFDVGGLFGDNQGVLFEPVSVVNYRSFTVFKSIKPVRAFAVVDSNGSAQPDLSLSGEALVIDYANGAMWGYSAYNAMPIKGVSTSGSVSVVNPFDFSDRVERFGEVLTDKSKGVQTPILPFSQGTETAFLVTPIAKTPPFQLDGTVSSTIGLRVSNSNTDVMFDRDENPFSGVRDREVTCVGRIDFGTLMSEATAQYLKEQGGWTTVKPIKGQSIVFKLEYNDFPELAGTALGVGSVNNALWLREGNRESLDTSTLAGTRQPVNLTFTIPEESPYPLVDISKAVSYNLPWPPKPTTSPMVYVDKGAFSSVTSKQ